MRSRERALGFGAALALLLGCSGTGDSPAGNGVRNTTGGVGSSTAGKGGNSSSGASGTSGDFGNTDGVPPDMAMQFTDAGGVNVTTNPDDVKCGGDKFKPKIEMEVIPGNILLVFDKSGSMDQMWGTGNTNKWTDAVAAIPAAVTPLEDEVTIGSIFFPYGNDNCTVPGVGMPPHIPFEPGPDFLADWANLGAAGVTPKGGTPLRAALMVADQYLQAELPDLVGITSVVIVTDGQPNCVDTGNAFSDDDSAPNLTPFIANWLTLDVKTYVVGLPGGRDPNETMAFMTLLNELAVAGGTTSYIPADDPTTLQTELAKIVSENVTTNFDTCTLPLGKTPPNPDDINLLVVNKGMENSVARDLGASGGWTIDANAENIILQGTFCELAKMGEYDEITVVYGCVEAPPLPPPPPLI